MSRPPLVIACLVLFGLACSPPPPDRDVAGSPEPTGGGGGGVLYEGALLLSGAGDAPVEASAFLVEDGVIVRVGQVGELTPPAAAARVDLSGKTVMPAIIGAHAHPGYQRGLSFGSELYSRELLLADLQRAAYFGVGTLLSMGIDPGNLVFQVREETARGTHGGARLLAAGRGIGAPDAGPGLATWAGVAWEVTTEEEGRAAVRELAAERVDQVKIWVDDRGGRAPALAPSVYRAVIDEARSRGLPVTAHVFYHADALDLVEAGVHAFAHLPRDEVMSDALVAAVVERGVWVMPNLALAQRSTRTEPPWAADPHLLGLLEDTVEPEVVARVRESYEGRTPEAAAAARERYAILEASVAKLAAAGARVVVGPDTGLMDHFPGYAEQRELELLVAAGMSPAQVIVAATSAGAGYLGLENTGRIAPGMRADFVVLDGSPLGDIRNTRRIAAVHLGGIELDRDAIRTRLGGAAPAP